jgi:hypothetical protein
MNTISQGGGYYEFPFVPEGDYMLLCGSPGYVQSLSGISVSASQPLVEREMTLVRDSTFVGPRAPSIQIDAGDMYTMSLNVMLNLQVDNATEVIVSDDHEFTTAAWQALPGTLELEYTFLDSTNTVIYAKYRDGAMIESQIVADGITFLSEPTTGQISVTSTPSGAAIYWNGTSTGLLTPAVITGVPEGTHRVSVAMQSFTPVPLYGYVTMVDGGFESADFDLTYSGVLPAVVGVGVFHVSNNISVPLGQTTTLVPGCTLMFDGHYSLTVQGILNAVGSSTDSIYFTCDTTANSLGWNGISIASPDTCRFEYCVIQHTKSDENFGGAVRCVTVDWETYPNFLMMNRCTIRNNFTTTPGAGLWIGWNASASISRCLIADNHSESWAGGLGCFGWSSQVTVENCVFSIVFLINRPTWRRLISRILGYFGR